MYTEQMLRDGLAHMQENVRLALAAGDRHLASAMQDKVNWLNQQLSHKLLSSSK